MRTTSRAVTFTRPFAMMGTDGMQPAGTYTVETDEEPLPSLLHEGYRRTGTWLILPAHAARAGSSQLVSIDPAELEAALSRDAPTRWSAAAETSDWSTNSRRRGDRWVSMANCGRAMPSSDRFSESQR